MSNDSVSRQPRPRSDYASAQSDLGLGCPHMPEDTFSHGPYGYLSAELEGVRGVQSIPSLTKSSFL